MSLTLGSGPFAPSPAGRFNFPLDAPDRVLYLEPTPRRVRAVFEGRTVVESDRAMLLHETRATPVYYFPRGDVREDLLRESGRTEGSEHKGPTRRWSVTVGERTAEDAAWSHPEPPPEAPQELGGLVALDWDAMDAWYEEDEEVFVHPRDPYHRVDVQRSSRRVRVVVDGEVVAESARPRILFETGLPPRYYIPREDVRTDLLVESDAHTRCPYKGRASYFSLRTGAGLREDFVWHYPDPLPAVEPIRDLLAFYDERVELEVDGVEQERPVTKFS